MSRQADQKHQQPKGRKRLQKWAISKKGFIFSSSPGTQVTKLPVGRIFEHTSAGGRSFLPPGGSVTSAGMMYTSVFLRTKAIETHAAER